MKKINVASFFTNESARPTNRFLKAAVYGLLAVLMLVLIGTHGYQLFCWYKLFSHYQHLKKQEARYRNLCNEQSALVNKQEGFRSKMHTLRSYHYNQEDAIAKIGLLCALPVEMLIKAHSSPQKFEATVTVSEQKQALLVVANLKMSPLVRAVRIVSLSKHEAIYTAVIEGSWNSSGRTS